MKNRLLMFVACGLIVGFHAQAAMVIDWKADAADAAWATGSNWVFEFAPTSDTTTNIARFNQTAYLSQPNADTTSIAGIAIGDGSTATAALALSGASLTTGADGIAMWANAGAATISAPMVLDSAQTWTNDSASLLEASGGVNLGVNALTLAGSGDIKISAAVSGAGGSLNKSGPGSLTLTTSNSYGGGTNINAGTLYISDAGALGTTGTINLGDSTGAAANASLMLTSAMTFSRQVTVRSGNGGTAILGTNHTTNTSGVFTGGVVLNKGLTLTAASGSNSVGNTTIGGTTQIDSVISGTGDVMVDAGTNGLVYLGHNNTQMLNSFVGSFTLSSGILMFSGGSNAQVLAPGAPGPFGASGNNLYINGGIFTEDKNSVWVPSGYNVTIGGSAQLGANNAGASNKSLGFVGPVTIDKSITGVEPQTIKAGMKQDERPMAFLGTVTLKNDITLADGVNLDAATGATGRFGFGGGIDLAAGNRTITLSNTGLTGFAGALTGSGQTLTLAGTNANVDVGAARYNGGTKTNLSGNGAINVNGATVNFSQGGSTYSGGTTLTSGILRFTANSVGALTSGPLGIGALTLVGGTVTTGNAVYTVNNAVIADASATTFTDNNNQTLNLTGAMEFKNSPTLTQNGANIVNLGNVTLTSNGSLAGTGSAFNLNNGITLPGDRALTFTGGGAKTIGGAMSGAFTLDLVGTSQNVHLGNLTGSSSVVRINDAALKVIADNTSATFSGGVALAAGTLQFNVNSVVSPTSGPFGTSTLSLLGGVVMTDGNNRSIGNAVVLNGAVSMTNNNDSSIILAGTTTVSGTSSLAATLGGGASFNMVDVVLDAPLSFSGSGGNGFSIGTLNVSAGHQLDSTNTSGNGVTINNTGGAGNLTVGSGYFRVGGTGAYAGGTHLNGGTTRILNNNALQAGTALALGAGATLELNGYEQSVAGLTGNAAGTIRNANMPTGLAAKLTVNTSTANIYDGTFGDINGNKLALVKAGAGSLTLSNATHNGLNGVSIEQGLLTINGGMTGTVPVVVQNTGILSGSGSFGGALTVQTGGTVSPGSSLGTLSATGNATFDTGSTFVVQVNGSTEGTQYDRLTVGGAVGLTLTGSVALNASIGYAAAPTDKIWIASLTNKSAVVTGTFDGLAQGATVSLGSFGGMSYTAKISYNGNVGSGATTGTGQNFNDIVLYDFVATGSGAPYTTWANGAAFSDDANGDGVDNGLAWMLGADDPNADALGLLPTPTASGGALTLHFKRVNPLTPAHLYLEYSSDLGVTDPWHVVDITTATTGDSPVGGDIGVVVIPGTPTDDVTLTIPVGHSAGGKLFARIVSSED